MDAARLSSRCVRVLPRAVSPASASEIMITDGGDDGQERPNRAFTGELIVHDVTAGCFRRDPCFTAARALTLLHETWDIRGNTCDNRSFRSCAEDRVALLDYGRSRSVMTYERLGQGARHTWVARKRLTRRGGLKKPRARDQRLAGTAVELGQSLPIVPG